MADVDPLKLVLQLLYLVVNTIFIQMFMLFTLFASLAEGFYIQNFAYIRGDECNTAIE